MAFNAAYQSILLPYTGLYTKNSIFF